MIIVTPHQLRQQQRTAQRERDNLRRTLKRRREKAQREQEAAEFEAIRSQMQPVEVGGCARRAERFSP